MTGDRHNTGGHGVHDTGADGTRGVSEGKAVVEHPAADLAGELRARTAAEEFPSLRCFLELARTREEAGEAGGALRWALAATDAGDNLAGLKAKGILLAACSTNNKADAAEATVFAAPARVMKPTI